MNTVKRKWIQKTATVISVLFHPVFIPLFGLIIIYSAPTLLSYIPFNIKRGIFILVTANNVIIPLSMTAVFYSRGIIKSVFAQERSERIILLTFSLVMYSITALLLLKVPVPSLIKAYFVSIAVVTLATLFITFFYRLSLHAASTGGLLALAGFMIFRFNIVSVSHIIILLIVCGAVLTSRLYLEEHKSGEVLTGFVTGAAVMSLSLHFLLN
jgi:hypothetical protein